MMDMDKVVEGAGKILESVPTIYDDGIKPTVQESGKTLALIPRTINAALVPLRKWIIEREHSLEETEKLLAQKLENVEGNKIVTPDAYVAVPAIQAISYSMDSEELRNLYANLLAKSMNVDTKESVHPSFVEIIKQMSPVDANVFKIIYEARITPLINLSIKFETGGNDCYIYNISWITGFNYENICISIDNLIRLGLIEIPFGANYTEDSNYDRVRNTLTYMNCKKKLESLHKGKIVEEKQYIKKTSLADSFYKVCIID